MTNQNFLTKFLDVGAYIMLIFTVVCVPLFVDGGLINGYVAAKQYLFIGCVLVTLLLFASKVIVGKRVALVRSFLDVPIVLVLASALLSAIFSVAVHDSFLGSNSFFIMNFVLLFFLGLWFWLLVHIVRSQRRWQGLLDMVILMGGFTALLFILKAVFHVDVLAPFMAGVWNTIDAANSSFGLWLVVIFLLSAGKLINRELGVGSAVAYFFIGLLSFTAIVLLGFKVVWWLAFFALVALLILGVSFIRTSRVGWLSVLFALLLTMVVLIIFGAPRALQSVVPAEVSLNAKSSWAIGSNTLFTGVKSFLLGSGLGSFGIDFSQFRSASFNNDQFAWSLRFNRPYSSALALITEGGILLAVLLGFLVVFVLGHILTSWAQTRSLAKLGGNLMEREGILEGTTHLDVFLVGIGWLILTAAWFVMYVGPALWWLWWLMLALTVIGLSFSSNRVFKILEITVEETPQYSLAFSFVMIVVMAAVVIFGVWGARLYAAEHAYARAVRSTNYSGAERELKNALSMRPSADLYHVGLAQIYLLEAIEESRAQKPDVQKVSTLLGLAVNEARAATDIAPRQVAIWENLATMYENAAILVPGAREWAIKSLQEARHLEPTNPLLAWRLGNNHSLAGQWTDATKQYQEAVDLKRDYIGAYVGLANAYEQTNQLDKAVATYQTILPSANNNVDVLFNYGRLLYNRNQKGDRDTAEQLWLAAVKAQPNYSNALYSLGLLNESRGNKASALQYYYKVKDLNPDNKDITAKIMSLVGGANAPSN